MALAVAKRHVRGRSLWPAGVSHVPAYIAGSLSQATPEIGIGDPGSEYDWLLFGYADRLYPWADYCGIPGGIPNRTTVYTTLTTSSTVAQANTAISNCPSGQVVALAAGNYSGWSGGTLTFPLGKSGVTLRGAGAGQTILPNVRINNGASYFQEATGIVVSSGATKGSMSIVLASTPTSYFSAGNLICIAEDLSPNKFATGIGTHVRSADYWGGIYGLNGIRCFRFVARVTSVAGNTVNLACPIPLDFTPALNIRAYSTTSNGCTSLCGVESLTIHDRSDPINFSYGDRMWVKDVELSSCSDGDNGLIALWSCAQPEVRRCYIHDIDGWPTQMDGHSMDACFGTCNGLFIDNMSYRVQSIIQMNGCAANAVVYNYGLETGFYSASFVGPGINSHGPHAMMNLIEGNIMPKFQLDGYHGSASHFTLLRNSINGLGPTGVTLERRMVDLCRGSYYCNAVGNVIGDSSYNPSYYTCTNNTEYASNYSKVYVLGGPNMSGYSYTLAEVAWYRYTGTYPDPNVEATLLRHGNYDYYNDATVWDGGISARDIPPSLFYDSKPSFFGSLAWPNIDNTAPTIGNNPAKARWGRYVVSGTLSDMFADES